MPITSWPGTKYNIPENTLHNRKKGNPNFSKAILGRRLQLSPSLAECLGILCRNGFSPSSDDVLDLMQKYQQANFAFARISNIISRKACLHNFMNRNSLSLKKPCLIAKTRKSASANPYVVYGCYKLLHAVVISNFGSITDMELQRNRISSRPNQLSSRGTQRKKNYLK